MASVFSVGYPDFGEGIKKPKLIDILGGWP
jgi:hypothetical protein